MGSIDRWTAAGLVAVAIRVIAAAVLVFGPWTNEPSELDGWDVDRFQQIIDADGQHYVDHKVEYPPGTVTIAEVLLADNVVDSHRRLVLLSLLVDLALATALFRHWGKEVASAYLLLGVAMVPSGLLRLDLWAALAAVLGAAAVAGARPHPSQHESIERRRPQLAMALFAVATVVGAMIKLWPALLVPAALGIGRARAAASAAALGLATGFAWLAVSGTAALEQITSLRGVTGWHLESVPGSLVALFSSASPRLEADAFRIGELNDTIVLAGRVLTVAVIAAAAALATRSNRQPSERLALVMLVAVTTPVLTAPLLSPQFLLWLTPWAAILHRYRQLAALTFGAVTLTAIVLAAFGPPNLDHPFAAATLLVRDGLLACIIAVSLRRLATPDWFVIQPGPPR